MRDILRDLFIPVDIPLFFFMIGFLTYGFLGFLLGQNFELKRRKNGKNGNGRRSRNND